jgi:DNA-binding GntR family transcriptional regulator
LTLQQQPGPGTFGQPPLQHGPVARGSRVAQIYQVILEAIVEHRLPPRAKLTEEALGEVFGVSRTIVRSALQALAHDEIITLARNRGAFVAAPSVAEAIDVFSARKLIETAIARDVAATIATPQVKALRELLKEEHAAMARGDRPAAIRLSGEFHLSVAKLRGEGVVTAFLKSLISRTSLVIALYGRGAASMCGHDEHEQIVGALEAREGERAAELMIEHLDHIFSDLDLRRRTEPIVDTVGVLRAGLLQASGRV